MKTILSRNSNKMETFFKTLKRNVIRSVKLGTTGVHIRPAESPLIGLWLAGCSYQDLHFVIITTAVLSLQHDMIVLQLFPEIFCSSTLSLSSPQHQVCLECRVVAEINEQVSAKLFLQEVILVAALLVAFFVQFAPIAQLCVKEYN